jgi:CheY-like chemotaxis protein
MVLSTEVSQVPKHILVVDDSLDLIGAYREVLQEQGYDVSTATGGDEALAQIRGRQFDLLITDIFMAGMDGFELISRVRHEVPAHLPIVAVSGMKAARDEALKRGADAFALKPLDYDVLVKLAKNGLAAQPPQILETSADAHRRVSRQLAEAAVEAYLANDPDALDGIRRILRVVSRFYAQPHAMLLWSSHGEIVLGGTSDPALVGKPLPKALMLIAQSVIECGSSLVASRSSGLMTELFDNDLRFVVGVPLMLSGMPIGTLIMFDDQPHVFTASELRLLEQVGARAAQLVGRVASGTAVDMNGLALRETFLQALSAIMQWSSERQQVLGLGIAEYSQSLPHQQPASFMVELPPRSLAGNLGMRAAFFTTGAAAGAVREQLSTFRTSARRLGDVVQWSQLVLDQPLPPLSALELTDWCTRLGEPVPGVPVPEAVCLELAEVPLSPAS